MFFRKERQFYRKEYKYISHTDGPGSRVVAKPYLVATTSNCLYNFAYCTFTSSKTRRDVGVLLLETKYPP